MTTAVWYDKGYEALWDKTVRSSRNATFLLQRAYMDYHSDRFKDCSMMFLDEKDNVLALCPACIDERTHCVASHGGLTYGGLVLPYKTHTETVGTIFEEMLKLCRSKNATHLIYKAIPHIYHKYHTEEDLYWLFRLNARLHSRGASSAISLLSPPPFSASRKYGVKRASTSGIVVEERTDAEAWQAYWDVLTEALTTRHEVRPTHSLSEMVLLKERFPNNIRLHVARTAQGEVLAGTVLFFTDRVVHSQYIAANDEGRHIGAIDLLFHHVLGNLHQKATSGEIAAGCFDFGISTEQNGRVLNEGLIFQKEGFGGRTICYDTYALTL